jgi:multiple sugar transport system permease protein
MTTTATAPVGQAATAVTVRTTAVRRRRSAPLTIGMFVCVAYFLLPLLWLAIASTKSDSGLFHSFGFAIQIHDFQLWRNVRDVLSYGDGQYPRWLLNTVCYAVASAGGAAILAAAGGYGFAKYDFAGKRAAFAVLIVAIMVPGVALTIPSYLLFAKIGIVNTPLAVILPSLVSPFGIYLMRIYAADAVDDSLLEAARIDGAGELRIFLRITLRLLAPGIVTVVLFTLVATWNNYFLPFVMLNDQRLFPVTVGLAQWNAQATGGGGAQAVFSLVITGSMVSVLPLAVAFLFLQRYWQSGLSVGAVKS